MIDDDKSVVPENVTIAALPGEDDQDSLARVTLAPVFRAVSTIKLMNLNGLDGMPGAAMNALVDRLDSLVTEAKNGDTEQIEAILLAQAQTLDALFNNLTRKSVLNMGQYIEAAEKYMKLALRAQANCRATLECFTNLKRPLVKQTNIAHGPQQVNIHPPDDNEAQNHTENEIPPNELLENNPHDPDKWLDQGAPQEAVGADQDLETVATIDRPKVA